MVAAGLVLWWQGALDDVGPAIRGANVPTIISGLLLYLAGLALLCLRWHILVRMTKGVSDLAKATEVFLISVSLNYVAPLKLAIPMRAAMTKKRTWASMRLRPGRSSSGRSWPMSRFWPWAPPSGW